MLPVFVVLTVRLPGSVPESTLTPGEARWLQMKYEGRLTSLSEAVVCWFCGESGRM
jgi:hypothetical protein